MKQTTIALLALIMAFATAGAANDYHISTLTGAPGPSCKQVETLYLDPDGLLWLGTGSTVERYDGRQYLTWTFEKQTDFPGENKVTAITRDANREYWVGSIQGVWKLNPKTFKIDRVLEDINIPVCRIAADSTGSVYIATIHGLYVYANGNLRHLLCDKTDSPRGNFMVDMTVENPSRVWGLTHNGVVRNNTEAGIFNKYPMSDLKPYGTLNCFVKVGDTLYIGTEKKGLLTFSVTNGKYSEFADHWHSAVTSLSIANDSILAVGTANDGLTLVDLRDGSARYSARYSATSDTGLASNSVSSILASGNNIWCGNPYYIGWSHLSRDNTVFKLFSTTDFDTKGKAIRSFLHTPRYLFTGTRDGFYVTDRQTGKTGYLAKGQPGAEALTSDLIFSFFQYGDEYLVGTCFGGLYRFDPATMSLSVPDLFSTISSNDIFSRMVTDTDDRLWIPTRGGLFRYDRKAQTLTGYTTMNTNLPGNIVYSVYIDRRGRFWTGTDKGVRLFDPATGRFSEPQLPSYLLHDAVVKFINSDSRNNLFFGTLYGELWMADENLHECRRLFADRKLDVRNIIDDDFGNYWLGTSIGVIKANPDMKVLAYYPGTEEIPDLEANSGSPLWKSPDGKIWMAGVKGLVEITPSPGGAMAMPKLVSVTVDGETVMDVSTTGLYPLALNKSHGNVVFHFMDPGYSDTRFMRLEYKLEGYDNDWHTIAADSDIEYYHLPPGSYRLMLRPYLGDKVMDMLEVKVSGIPAGWIWGGSIFIAAAVIMTGVIVYRRRKPYIISIIKRFVMRHEATEVAQPAALEESTEDSPKTKFSTAEMEEMCAIVKKYLEESKAYLNPDFKQPDLAAATGYSSQALSQMFNRYLDTGYYHFINAYRIDTFKRLISEGANERFTLMTIAGQSGFKSHTSFFRTFKKFTGVTPNDYIRQQKESVPS